MNEIRTQTLAALYPLETKRTIKNYASFLEENPEWLEFGNSLLDYKRQRVAPLYSGSLGGDSMSRPRAAAKGMA